MSQGRGQSAPRHAASFPTSMQMSCPTSRRARLLRRNSKSSATTWGREFAEGTWKALDEWRLLGILQVSLQEWSHHGPGPHTIQGDPGARPFRGRR